MVERGKEKLFAIPATERTFANTVRLYDEFKGLYRVGKEALDFYRMLSPDIQGRDAPYMRVKQEKARLYIDQRIYHAFKEYQEYGLPHETLTREEQYFFDKFMRRFERMGLHLPEDQLARSRELQSKSAVIAGRFQAAINNDASVVTAREDELAGVDASFIDGCARDEQGNVIIPANSVSYMAVLMHCHNSEVRKRLYMSYMNRAYPENRDNIIEFAAVNDIWAKQLGYVNYAQMYCDAMMVREMPSTDQRSDENVQLFIDDLVAGGRSKADAEFAERVRDLPEGIALVDGKLLPWDAGYVSAQYAKKFHFDGREVAKYFPVEQTTQGIFKIYEKFMNLEFDLTQNLSHEVREVALMSLFRL